MAGMREPVLVVTIPGKPRPQGSMQLSRDPRTGNEFAKYGQETVNHRNLVVGMLREGWGGAPSLSGPVAIQISAAFVRPKAHFGTGRNAARLKESAPKWMTSTPDADKLARLVLDAGTIAGIWGDDSQVALLRTDKRWGLEAKTVIEVWSL